MGEYNPQQDHFKFRPVEEKASVEQGRDFGNAEVLKSFRNAPALL